MKDCFFNFCPKILYSNTLSHFFAQFLPAFPILRCHGGVALLSFFKPILSEIMLSILIPVYNFDVRQLVRDLLEQVQAETDAFELLAYDDGSLDLFKQKNREIGNWQGVVYKELPENLGRARIRNRLAAEANFDYLLFMDCDSSVIREDYISLYLKHLEPETLLYGGRSYSTNPPAEPALFFHWWYGTKREVMPAKKRQQAPYHAFMTNNFLVPKVIFESIGFDEKLLTYGHEDTLFGLELKKRKVPMQHLDNPLEHIGLEPVEAFLAKSKNAISNLYRLSIQHPDLDTRLLSTYRRLDAWHLRYPVRKILHLLKNKLFQNLKSGSPQLRYFDLYKLWLLLEEAHQSR